MSRVALLLTGALLVTRLAWLHGQEPTSPQAVFRTTADLVAVDVSVRTAGSPLAGLTTSDVVLTDNGVTQQVEVVDAQAMPIDVTLIADVSHRTMSAWTYEVTPEQTLERLRADVKPMGAVR